MSSEINIINDEKLNIYDININLINNIFINNFFKYMFYLKKKIFISKRN